MRAERARHEVERLARALADANQRLRVHAEQVEELATAKERNRLAREIHDSLGHYLTVINVQLEAARQLLESQAPPAAEAGRALTSLRKAQSLAQEGLADVRRSVAALRAGPNDGRPLPEARRTLTDEARAAGIVATFQLAGQPRPLTAQAELTLYRAAQEALTNVRKHARASRADVTLDFARPERVRLIVADNGVGSAAANGGFGLLGLRERVQLLGGSVSTHSAPGEGFRLEVEAPG
jgi:signal transduction histidine kinase